MKYQWNFILEISNKPPLNILAVFLYNTYNNYRNKQAQGLNTGCQYSWHQRIPACHSSSEASGKINLRIGENMGQNIPEKFWSFSCRKIRKFPGGSLDSETNQGAGENFFRKSLINNTSMEIFLHLWIRAEFFSAKSGELQIMCKTLVFLILA